MRSLTQKYEERIHAAGFARVCGIDEVGRGAWAGPLVAAGVIFAPGTKIAGINDSKKLTAENRKELSAEIKAKALVFCIQEIDNTQIDQIGVGKSNELLIRNIITELKPDYALIDKAWIKDLETPHDLIVKGDSKVFSIGAASIIAKVYRDGLMINLDKQYPGYGFADHKGYGTKEHQQALQKLGNCPIHRLSYHPIMQPKLI